MGGYVGGVAEEARAAHENLDARGTLLAPLGCVVREEHLNTPVDNTPVRGLECQPRPPSATPPSVRERESERGTPDHFCGTWGEWLLPPLGYVVLQEHLRCPGRGFRV